MTDTETIELLKNSKITLQSVITQSLLKRFPLMEDYNELSKSTHKLLNEHLDILSEICMKKHYLDCISEHDCYNIYKKICTDNPGFDIIFDNINNQKSSKLLYDYLIKHKLENLLILDSKINYTLWSDTNFAKINYHTLKDYTLEMYKSYRSDEYSYIINKIKCNVCDFQWHDFINSVFEFVEKEYYNASLLLYNVICSTDYKTFLYYFDKIEDSIRKTKISEEIQFLINNPRYNLCEKNEDIFFHFYVANEVDNHRLLKLNLVNNNFKAICSMEKKNY
jgi:hypothetical protein